MISRRHPTLLAIAGELTARFEETSIRGQDAASFIFVREGNKSVEVSMLDENRIWVEFWDLALGEDTAPLRDQIFSNSETVIDEVVNWLQRNA